MERKPSNRTLLACCGACLVFLLLLAGISSCNKSGADCFTSTGAIVSQMREAADFDTIIAKENVDIVLTQDSVNSIMVEAGKNIVDGITTVITDRQLFIDNTNTCNWVRSYDKPLRVHVHAKNLRKLWYLSAGNITTTNAINTPSFLLDVWGGCGSIDLNLNVINGFIYEHLGTADITLRGRVVYNSVVSGDFGLLQLKDLSTDFTYISNTGTNNCYVNVHKSLDATIRSIGDIYYTGKPDTIHAHILGAGHLIEY